MGGGGVVMVLIALLLLRRLIGVGLGILLLRIASDLVTGLLCRLILDQ
jgi:hypothetical protein